MDYDKILEDLERKFVKRQVLVDALKRIHDWPPEDPQAIKEIKLIAGYALADLANTGST